jgi:hypothetical protein
MRYDQALNAWGGEWGPTNKVIVAINGSFFDPETGVPWSGQIQSGWYAKRFADRQNSSGFVWTEDRRAFVGACVLHRPGKQIITLQKTGEIFPFDGINVPHGNNDLILHPAIRRCRPAMDKKVTEIEILVELQQPLGFSPGPAWFQAPFAGYRR